MVDGLQDSPRSNYPVPEALAASLAEVVAGFPECVTDRACLAIRVSDLHGPEWWGRDQSDWVVRLSGEFAAAKLVLLTLVEDRATGDPAAMAEFRRDAAEKVREAVAAKDGAIFYKSLFD